MLYKTLYASFHIFLLTYGNFFKIFILCYITIYYIDVASPEVIIFFYYYTYNVKLQILIANFTLINKLKIII